MALAAASVSAVALSNPPIDATRKASVNATSVESWVEAWPRERERTPNPRTAAETAADAANAAAADAAALPPPPPAGALSDADTSSTVTSPLHSSSSTRLPKRSTTLTARLTLPPATASDALGTNRTS